MSKILKEDDVSPAVKQRTQKEKYNIMMYHVAKTFKQEKKKIESGNHELSGFDKYKGESDVNSHCKVLIKQHQSDRKEAFSDVVYSFHSHR